MNINNKAICKSQPLIYTLAGGPKAFNSRTEGKLQFSRKYQITKTAFGSHAYVLYKMPFFAGHTLLL